MSKPGFIESTLKEQLGLPIRQPAESAITSGAQNLVQQISNFGSASSVLKQSEAVAKIASSGLAPKFGSLTNGLKFGKSDGTINLINSATGKILAPVGAYQTQSVPASLVTNQNENRTDDFKVVITQQPNLTQIDGQIAFSTVVFDVMPQITESRSVTYDTVGIIHHPGDILKYKSTASRSWSVKATLASRTSSEATKNRKIVNTIRSWAMPFHGAGTEKTAGTKYLGAPPPILTLEAYGDKMIGPVKCVMDSYDWSWPNDVDYIPTDDNLEPFPVILEISISLKESFSPAEYSGFDLIAYRTGKMNTSFIAVKSGPKQQQASTSAQVAAAPSTVSTNEPKSITSGQAAAQQSPQPPQQVIKPIIPKSPSLRAPGNITGIDTGANTVSDLGGMP